MLLELEPEPLKEKGLAPQPCLFNAHIFLGLYYPRAPNLAVVRIETVS